MRGKAISKQVLKHLVERSVFFERRAINNKLLGVAGATLMPSIWGNTLHFSLCWVAPSERKTMEVIRSLEDTVEAYAREVGADLIVAEVKPRRSYKVFEKNGYRQHTMSLIKRVKPEK